MQSEIYPGIEALKNSHSSRRLRMLEDLQKIYRAQHRKMNLYLEMAAKVQGKTGKRF